MLWDEDRETRERDVEEIRIQDGSIGLDFGFFCLIRRDGLCVEDFGSTRRQALRRARRAWQKEKLRASGYPKVRACD